MSFMALFIGLATLACVTWVYFGCATHSLSSHVVYGQVSSHTQHNSYGLLVFIIQLL